MDIVACPKPPAPQLSPKTAEPTYDEEDIDPRVYVPGEPLRYDRDHPDLVRKHGQLFSVINEALHVEVSRFLSIEDLNDYDQIVNTIVLEFNRLKSNADPYFARETAVWRDLAKAYPDVPDVPAQTYRHSRDIRYFCAFLASHADIDPSLVFCVPELEVRIRVLVDAQCLGLARKIRDFCRQGDGEVAAVAADRHRRWRAAYLRELKKRQEEKEEEARLRRKKLKKARR